MGLTYEENETHIHLDYAANNKEGVVKVYTTRRGEKNGILRRIGKENLLNYREVTAGDEVIAWSLEIPMDMCRNGFYITKRVANKDSGSFPG